MNSKRNLKNIVFTLIGQIVVLGLALAVPRFMLTGYGSDTNGLVSTVTQIMAYMAMLEAGIGRATRNELYKYIHDNVYDAKNVSRIVSISQNTYRRTTRLYAFIVIILAAVLPFILKTDADHLTVLLIILIEGASGIVSFYFVQCWTDLLAAEGKQYVSSNIDLMYRVLIYAVKIIMAAAGINILFMELGFFAATIVKLIFFRIYVRKNYAWLNITKDTKRTQLPDKNSFMVAEIAWTVFSSTDMIVLSVFCSTKISSVYSIYYMVFITINKLMDAVFTSLKFNLGQKYHADTEEYKEYYILLYLFEVQGQRSADLIVAAELADVDPHTGLLDLSPRRVIVFQPFPVPYIGRVFRLLPVGAASHPRRPVMSQMKRLVASP